MSGNPTKWISVSLFMASTFTVIVTDSVPTKFVAVSYNKTNKNIITGVVYTTYGKAFIKLTCRS